MDYGSSTSTIITIKQRSTVQQNNRPHYINFRYNSSTTSMSAQQTHVKHAGTCQGHCRAQRFTLNHCTVPYYCSEQYEKDKAAITSYEDGIDGWDGPIWPWRTTGNSEAQLNFEEEWQGCCTEPVEEPQGKVSRAWHKA
jgi:hypothetical protein